MMNDHKLTGVMIGAGFFASFHAESWRRIPGAELVAVADPMVEKAREFAAKWRIPRVYADAEEMLEHERPNFVDIVTRPDARLSLLRLAASHGIHVICQKPMAPTWDECVAMVETCRAAGVRLLMHENWRWQPWYREIKDLLDRGVAGAIFHAAFQMRTGDGRGPEPYAVQPYFREMGRLLVYETAVHFLDTFRFLLGEITSVFCQTGRINPVITGEDYAVVQLSFAGGARGLLDCNRIAGRLPAPVAFGALTLEGERGTIRMTPEGELWIVEYGKQEIRHDYLIPAEGFKGDSIKATQEHLIRCLLTGERCESEGEDYLKTVAAVFACYASAESGRVVPLEPG
jgi:predicted dehydrogenase